jgi:siroheme synthase-like protein
LAIAATDDPEVNRQVHADAQAARVWVNAADDPEACAFTLPAVVRQGPVTVAVSTGGHSPALAGWLRDQVAGLLGPEIGRLAELLSEARDELQAAGRSTEGIDWRRALDSDMLELIRTGRMAQARERLQACLS